MGAAYEAVFVKRDERKGHVSGQTRSREAGGPPFAGRRRPPLRSALKGETPDQKMAICTVVVNGRLGWAWGKPSMFGCSSRYVPSARPETRRRPLNILAPSPAP